MDGLSSSDEDQLDTKPTPPPRIKPRSKGGPPRHVSHPTQSEYYDMTCECRGVALVLNHKKFKRMNTRTGTEKDQKDVSAVLKDLHFDVRVHNDLSYKDLMKVLKALSEEDHSRNDCFCVVVMTHGEAGGKLYAQDLIYKADELWEPFMGEKCSSLIGKPKLFFIQACRGEKLDQGVQYQMDSIDSKQDGDTRLVYTIPAMADLLVMYSTYDGHYSWRNPDNGSWFIQALVAEFKENAALKDLLTLLTGVARRVAYSYQSNVPTNEHMDAMKQMPCITSMLTKVLYFTRKR